MAKVRAPTGPLLCRGGRAADALLGVRRAAGGVEGAGGCLLPPVSVKWQRSAVPARPSKAGGGRRAAPRPCAAHNPRGRTTTRAFQRVQLVRKEGRDVSR